MGGVVAQRVLELGADRGLSTLAELRDMFEPGRLFVELQQHGFPEQNVLNDILVQSARKLELPVVATNDVHFMGRDDGVAQIYLECVRLGRTFSEAEPLHHGSFEMYLKSQEEMVSTFSALPEAVQSTLAVAEMCSELKLVLGQPMLPHFQVPEGYDTDGYFRHFAREGLQRVRLGAAHHRAERLLRLLGAAEPRQRTRARRLRDRTGSLLPTDRPARARRAARRYCSAAATRTSASSLACPTPARAHAGGRGTRTATSGSAAASAAPRRCRRHSRARARRARTDRDRRAPPPRRRAPRRRVLDQPRRQLARERHQSRRACRAR
jgi:hypothetical protein